MENRKLTVVQCWDDGVASDRRLTEILRRHRARATFNLNAGLHEKGTKPCGVYQGIPVAKLGWDEMRSVYAGFTIANHSLTHPHLEQIPLEAARRDIVENRDRLQQFFGQPVWGFAYPYGTYNAAVMAAVRETGHRYARTTRNVEQPFPPADPLEFHPCCHFLAPDFMDRYAKARTGGVFYFWGHSYELVDDAMWSAFEKTIERISADPTAEWGDVAGLFQPPPDPFEVAIDCLKKDGLVQEAGRLDSLRHHTAWTTGTEMIGELGLELKRAWPAVKARGSPETRTAFKTAAKLVRKSWSLFGL